MLAGPRSATPFPCALVGGHETQRLGIEKRPVIFTQIQQDALERSNPLGALEFIFKRIRPRRADLHFFIPLSGMDNLDQSGGGSETGELINE